LPERGRFGAGIMAKKGPSGWRKRVPLEEGRGSRVGGRGEEKRSPRGEGKTVDSGRWTVDGGQWAVGRRQSAGGRGEEEDRLKAGLQTGRRPPEGGTPNEEAQKSLRRGLGRDVSSESPSPEGAACRSPPSHDIGRLPQGNRPMPYRVQRGQTYLARASALPRTRRKASTRSPIFKRISSLSPRISGIYIA